MAKEVGDAVECRQGERRTTNQWRTAMAARRQPRVVVDALDSCIGKETTETDAAVENVVAYRVDGGVTSDGVGWGEGRRKRQRPSGGSHE